jgi:hypothetical protein
MSVAHPFFMPKKLSSLPSPQFMFKEKNDIWMYGFGLLVFFYLILRCIYVPPYPDEILNFHVYVDTEEFIPFQAFPDANNHFISTLFNWISFKIFGPNVLYMRIFELLSFPLFFIYLMKMRRFFENKLVGNSFVLAVSSGIFLLTFFSLARGYGMSMAFFLASFYYLLLAYHEKSLKAIFLGCLFGNLVLWSNLSMSISVLIILALFFFKFVQQLSDLSARSRIKNVAKFTLIAILPALIAVLFSFDLKAEGAFWLGGETGFFVDVILDLSQNTFGLDGIWYTISICGFFSILMILNIKNLKVNPSRIIVSTILLATFLGTISLHLFLVVNYGQNRAALHILILVLLFLFIWMDSLKNKLHYTTFLIPILFIAHHLYFLNFSYPYCWRRSTMDIELYSKILEKQEESEQLLTLSGPFYFGENVHYFNYLEPSRLNNVQWSDFPSATADLLLVNTVDNVQNNNEFDTIFHHPTTEVSLLERKTKIEWETHSQIEINDIESSDSTISILNTTIDWSRNNLMVTFLGDLTTNEKVKFACLEIEINNGNNETVRSETIVLNQFRPDFTTTVKTEKAFYFSSLVKGEYEVEIFILNPRNYKWNVSEASVKLHEN